MRHSSSGVYDAHTQIPDSYAITNLMPYLVWLTGCYDPNQQKMAAKVEVWRPDAECSLDVLTTSCLHNLKERIDSDLYIPLFLGYRPLLFTGACEDKATGIFTVLGVHIGVRRGDLGSLIGCLIHTFFGCEVAAQETGKFGKDDDVKILDLYA
ncbi:hypothetical protein M431DRAFT_487272 [Trichoderma harzianum CBS 226.95]|uniref:Uncharacterized protein n=1 Tax=Trichoderma harzianum CBS 226.95 TaxID=983964 RepID=A0A2T3ZVI2_TRIHA|nr:hypothetical protein M431DRAFT_487272 [Trichoderma harzianum CBS 226.95]PTB48821.1 hypothetical protein M431DRAFT_487272 [Trichoderma harzianum CBS 226.95]